MEVIIIRKVNFNLLYHAKKQKFCIYFSKNYNDHIEYWFSFVIIINEDYVQSPIIRVTVASRCINNRFFSCSMQIPISQFLFVIILFLCPFCLSRHQFILYWCFVSLHFVISSMHHSTLNFAVLLLQKFHKVVLLYNTVHIDNFWVH